MRRNVAAESNPIHYQTHGERSLHRLRRWSHLLDNAFRIPGTRIRFGWDSIIGLVPGFGDAATGLFSVLLLTAAFRNRVPRVIKARMLLNILVDLVVGAIPFLGDLFDFAWKANSRNLVLLEKHGIEREKPGTGDWVFVLSSVALVLALVAVPVIALAILMQGLTDAWIPGPPLWRLL